MTILILLALLGVSLALLYLGRGYLAWVIPGAGALLALALRGAIGWPTFNTVGLIFAAVALLFGLPPLRRLFVGRIAMGALSRALPGMSETERVALEAGTVWWDAELFSGNPSWQRLLDLPSHSLTEEEQAFLDGPVEELCSMIDDWKARNRGDLPPEAWEFVKRHRFFGMIIPKEYGGLGFSALAHSQVVTKVSSRSVAAAVTVMVPNSLGPAELILHYGTDEQKRSYLPDLARGDEIPCFALTEPGAGSDAASMQSEGVVCKGTWEGEEVIGIRLNWNKRYITLVSVATVLGLAFRLRDPDHLLGEADDLGITCALVPTDLTGVDAARRHDPLGVPFINGPTTGRNVFVPIDSIIGGREMAGKGWLMLMQCLASGRGISLPALAGGAAQLATRTTSAYAGVRQQFNVKIGAFEGIEERLARIGGYTYMMNAARRMTAGAVDSGEKPAVISAIVKAYMTEMMRTVINDAMDVQAGAAISRGPRNVLSGAYESLPIGITVEGANILTRSLIIYGQGAMRCHPFLREQMEAIADRDLKRFDRAFFRHMGFVFSNGARSLLLGLTGGALANPPVGGDCGKVFSQLTRMSAAFATLSDAAMLLLGGSLKRREKISGRFADALAWMYFGSALLKHYVGAGRPAGERPFFLWGSRQALFEIEKALQGILDNFPARPVAILLRRVLFPLGSRHRAPRDRVGAQVARALLNDGETRNALTRDIYTPAPDEQGLGTLERAFELSIEAAPIVKEIRKAVRAGRLEKSPRSTLAERARQQGVIDEEQWSALRAAEEAREDVIQVDSFESQPCGEVRV